MTVSDAHIAFKIETDKNAVNIGMSGCPSFLPEEIDYWLYSAYLVKVATKFTGNNSLQTPFEGSVKRIADLEGLVRVDKGLTLLSESTSNRLTMSDFKSSITYGDTAQDKRMYFIQGVLHFGSSKLANVRPISHQQALNFLETYNNKPWIEEPVAILEDNKLIVFVDRDLMIGPYTIDITYLAYPRKINNLDITSTLDEVPEYMQYEIVKLAADMAIENIESQRVQTHQSYVTQLSE